MTGSYPTSGSEQIDVAVFISGPELVNTIALGSVHV